MRDTEFECMSHGWRSTYQVCPFCLNMIFESDIKKLKQENDRLSKRLKEIENVDINKTCGELSCDECNDRFAIQELRIKELETKNSHLVMELKNLEDQFLDELCEGVVIDYDVAIKYIRHIIKKYGEQNDFY